MFVFTPEFSNGANKQKLLDRVRHMCELFDRPCLIIERDRVKTQDKKQPKIMWELNLLHFKGSERGLGKFSEERLGKCDEN